MSKHLPIFIPQTADELTAQWLTEAIRSSGLSGEARVTDFATGPPGAGVGFSGLTLKVELTWDRHEPGAPAVVLLKVPSDNPGNRGLVEAEGGYDREFDFYERFSGDLPIAVPRLVHAVRDPGPTASARRRQFRLVDGLPRPATKFIGRHARRLVRPTKRRYALLLEYVERARVTTAEEIPPPGDLSAILESLARMHAHLWRQPVLGDVAVVEWRTVSQMPNLMHGLYRAHRDDVVARMPDVFTDDLMRFADWFGDRIVSLTDHLNEPLALLHGDSRTDNMLFTDDDLVLIDFGMFGSGRPACDVAYLLSQTIPKGSGARAEFQGLCREYHAVLVASGVADHPLEEFLNDADIVLALQAYRLLLIESSFEADYGGVSLSEVWGTRLLALLPDQLPVV